MSNFMSNDYKYKTNQHHTCDNEQHNTIDIYIPMGQRDTQWARSNYCFYDDQKVLKCRVAEHSIPRFQLRNSKKHRGLIEMIIRGLTTCHTQYTWDRSICISLFNRTTLRVFVTYLTGALYVHPLWFYKHQHDNRVRSKLFVACQRWWFQWRFWFVPSVPGYLREAKEHKPDPWRNPIERNHMGFHLDNEVASC